MQLARGSVKREVWHCCGGQIKLIIRNFTLSLKSSRQECL